MPTPQEKQILINIQKDLETLALYDDGKMTRKDLAPELEFSYVSIYIQRSLAIYRKLKDAPLECLVEQSLKQVQQRVAQAAGRYKELAEFSIAKYPDNVMQKRNNIIQAIVSEYFEDIKILQPIIDLLVPIDSEIIKITKEQKKSLKSIETERLNIKSKSEELQKEIELTLSNLQKESNEALMAVRSIAGEAGVSHHAQIFAQQANQHKKYANIWLSISVAVLVLAVFAISWITKTYIEEIKDLDEIIKVLPITISRLVMVTISLYAVLWSTKNYNAHRHNEVINRHRQNALSTFKSFVEAAKDDPATKNTILIQATQCIFSVQRCGYLKGDSDSMMPNNLINIPLPASPKLKD